LRDRIRRWQPQLRSLFLMRIASLKYRLQAPGFEVPETVRRCQQAYDEASARMLEQVADRIEDRAPGIASDTKELPEFLKRTLHDVEAEALRELPAVRAESFVKLLRAINDLTKCLVVEIAADPTESC